MAIIIRSAEANGTRGVISSAYAIDGQSQIQVHTNERTHVHSVRSSLVVNYSMEKCPYIIWLTRRQVAVYVLVITCRNVFWMHAASNWHLVDWTVQCLTGNWLVPALKSVAEEIGLSTYFKPVSHFEDAGTHQLVKSPNKHHQLLPTC